MTMTKREQQLMFLYAVVTIIVSYYAVTIWLPNIYQFIRVRTERAVILESVKKEVANDVFDVKDLAVAITKKVEDAKAPRVHKINPRFHLKQNTIQAARIMSSKPKQKEESIKELKNLSIPNLKLGSSSTVSFNRTTANWEADSRSSPGMVLTPANSSKPHVLTLPIEITAQRSLPGRTYLGTFAPDSIEAKLHQARQPQPQPPAVSEAEMAQLSSERDLREQQDQEYRESLRRDEAVVRKSDAEQEFLLKVEARRKELASKVHSEPEVNPSDKDIVTLSFRFRNQASGSKANSATPIKRRFSVRQHTVEDVLDFIESLELRPLFTDFDLTLDFPTRVLNRSVQGNLETVGISTDSVVWIKFVE